MRDSMSSVKWLATGVIAVAALTSAAEARALTAQAIAAVLGSSHPSCTFPAGQFYGAEGRGTGVAPWSPISTLTMGATAWSTSGSLGPGNYTTNQVFLKKYDSNFNELSTL